MTASIEELECQIKKLKIKLQLLKKALLIQQTEINEIQEEIVEIKKQIQDILDQILLIKRGNYASFIIDTDLPGAEVKTNVQNLLTAVQPNQIAYFVLFRNFDDKVASSENIRINPLDHTEILISQEGAYRITYGVIMGNLNISNFFFQPYINGEANLYLQTLGSNNNSLRYMIASVDGIVNLRREGNKDISLKIELSSIDTLNFSAQGTLITIERVGDIPIG